MIDGDVNDDEALHHGIIVREADFNREALNPAFGVQEVEEDLTQLQLYIEEGQWEEALNRLMSHPHEVHHPRAQPGSKARAMTALHLALETGECPLPVIHAILARKPLAAAMRDNHGNTPLHIACAGQFSYDHRVICCLLAAYPQAVLLSEDTEGATPLHMLLTLGGDVSLTCVTLLLDVAYSRMAGLPLAYVPLVDMICSPLSISMEIVANFPPRIVQLIRELAISDPYNFPSCFQPFLYLPQPETLECISERMENQGELLIMTDCKGHTPLHTCCSRALMPDVVRVLLNEHRYPGAHRASFVLDNKQRYALFYAACYQLPFEGAKLVFDVNPDAIRHIEEYRLLYPHVAYISPVYSQKDRTLELISTRLNPSDDIRNFFKTETMYKLYCTIEFYVRLTYHGTYLDPPPRHSKWRALHAIASVQSPPQVIRAAIGLYPWLLHERDEGENLPLHLACKNTYEEGNDEIHYWCLKGVNREKIHHRIDPEDLERENPITLFAVAEPRAAKCFDNDYCLPLHNAICSQKGFNDGIKSLISAAPQTLTVRDGKHHLYPFLLAAMDEVNTLDTVFDLLQSNPTLVQDGIQAFTQHMIDKDCVSNYDHKASLAGEKESNKRYKSSDDENEKSN